MRFILKQFDRKIHNGFKESATLENHEFIETICNLWYSQECIGLFVKPFGIVLSMRKMQFGTCEFQLRKVLTVGNCCTNLLLEQYQRIKQKIAKFKKTRRFHSNELIRVWFFVTYGNEKH